MQEIKKVFALLIPFFLLCSSGCIEEQSKTLDNSIFVIYPYKYRGTWVFDDYKVGLVREPFVAGIPEIVDELTKDIPSAEGGFKLFFSATPFPDYQIKLVWRRSESGGNWYYCEDYDLEGWLCPAMFKYFKKTPKEIYIKAEKK